MAEHLVVHVEEQIAKRLLDHGLPQLAKEAIIRSSLPNDTPLEELQSHRYEPTSAEEEKARAKEAASDAMGRLRSERNALLRGSDWSQLPDAPTASVEKWAAYRQKLRDLPSKTKNPENVKWPEVPDA